MKKKLITAFVTAFVAISAAFVPGFRDVLPLSINAEAAAVSAPSFSKPAGRYNTQFSLKLTAASAKIYYTTNGTTPTTASKLYNGAITLSKSCTVKAIAVSGGVKSSVVSKKYTISPKKPTCSLTSGTYSGSQSVTLKCTTVGSKIYYTLDGTKPTTKSTLYSGSIKIDKSCKLRAVAVKTGMSKSAYLTRTFTIESVSADTVDMNGYENKYGYNSLTATGKKAYKAIYDAAVKFAGSVNVEEFGYSSDDIGEIYFIVRDDNPWLFYLYGGYSTSFYTEDKAISLNLRYTMTSADYKTAQARLKTRVDDVIAKVNDKSNLFDKLLVIHDEIVDNCYYNNRGKQTANAYGCLVDGYALCEGYSRAFQLLCHEAGIQNILVSGYAGEDHMWNMVQLDGEWYHFDITWDDPVSSTPDYKTYKYFNVTTAQITDDHTIKGNHYTVPQAYGTKYNYYVYNNIEIFTSTSKAIEQLKALIAEAQKTQQTEVSVMCTLNVYNGIKSDFISNQEYSNYFRTLNELSDNTLQYSISIQGHSVGDTVETTLTLNY